MNQYIVLIQGQTKSLPTEAEWTRFFELATASGMFRGGSEIGERELIGDPYFAKSTDHVVGFLRFDALSAAPVRELLRHVPVVAHGSVAELCEMPKS